MVETQVAQPSRGRFLIFYFALPLLVVSSLGIWAAVAGGGWQRAFDLSLGLAVAVWAFMLTASAVRGYFRAGRIIADLGRQKEARSFASYAGLLGIIFLSELGDVFTRGEPFSWGTLVGTGYLTVFLLMLGLGPLQLRENGIWSLFGLTPWRRVQGYTLEQGTKFTLHLTQPSYPRRYTMTFDLPQDKADAVKKLLE